MPRSANLHGLSMQQLRREFPQATAVWARDHPLGTKFRQSTIDPIDRFHDRWNEAYRHFLDKRMEKARRRLWESVHGWEEKAAEHVFPLRGEWYGVPPEWMDEQPDRFRRAAQELASAETAIATAYEELVRLARQRLHV